MTALMEGIKDRTRRAIFPPERESALKLEFFGHAKAGYFVDVGANDPMHGSQTWLLEEAGWTGVLIEPQPALAEQLRKARKAMVFAVACSAPKNAGKLMPLHLAGPLSSLNENLMDVTQRAEITIEVPVRTLDDVLVEAGAPQPIDFLSIDVEGHEIEVLAGFDIARWQPRLILIEDHVLNLAKHRSLTRGGYRLIRRTGLNAWYVPAATAPRIGWHGSTQIVRKYYLGLPFRVARDTIRRVRSRVLCIGRNAT